MKKLCLLAALFSAFFIISCASDNVEEEPVEQPVVDQGPAYWLPISSVSELTGNWSHKDGSGYSFPVNVEGKTCLVYHTPWIDKTAYWKSIAEANGRTFDELWEERSELSFTDDRGNTFPVEDENGTKYVLRIRQDEQTKGVYFQYLYYIPQQVVAKNLSFFRISPDKTRFREAGRFAFGGSKIESLQQGNQIYQKR